MPSAIIMLFRPAFFVIKPICLFFLLYLLIPGYSLAKELYFIPSFNFRTEYDDNKRLLTERFDDLVDKSAYGVIISPEAKMGVKTDILDVSFNAKLDINRYFGDLDLDSDDVYLDFDSSFNVTERNIFGFKSSYVKNSTLTSELDVTGLVQDNIPRETWSVAPDWIYNLAEDKFLQANYNHTEVSYGESVFNQLFDFTTDSASISFVHQWNASLQNYISFSALFFEVPEIGRDTDEYSVNVGSEYQISETWSAALSVGGRFTHTKLKFEQPILVNGLPIIANGTILTEEVTLEDDAQGLVFSFSTDKEFATGSVGASYSRSTSPQGNGRLQLFDKFTFNYRQYITRQLQFLLNGGINVTTTSGSESLNDDRTYYYVSPSLRWHFNRQTYISGGYRFRRQEFEGNDSTQEAVSNAVFFSVNYDWDKFSTQEF